MLSRKFRWKDKYFISCSYNNDILHIFVVDTMNKSSRGCATTDSEMYDTGDDDLLEACVRTATAAPTSRAPRERKRAKNHRKSCMYG